MQSRMEAQSEKSIKLRALTQWRQATRERVEAKKMNKMCSLIYKRIIMRRYFNQWASAVKSKWKGKVEKGFYMKSTDTKSKVQNYLILYLN